MRGWRASALAISTICRRDSGRSLTSASGWMSSAPARASASSAMRRCARAVDQPEAARRVADRDVVGDREVGDQRQLLEDADDAGRVGRGRRRERDRLPSSSIVPSSGATTPAMILISVDLPAPFSPSTAWMRPALDARRRPGARARRRSASRRPRIESRLIRRSFALRSGPRGRATPRTYLFASVWPMISCAVKLMPQVGKALPTKKLSDCFG